MKGLDVNEIPEGAGVVEAAIPRSPAVLAWMRMARVFQKIDRATAIHLHRWGLSIAQFDVLAQVGEAGGLTQQELADRLLVTKGGVAQILERMERDGLICRRQQGRCKRVFLTDEGRRLRALALPAQESLIADHFAVLPPREQRRLLALLRRLDHALDQGASGRSPQEQGAEIDDPDAATADPGHDTARNPDTDGDRPA